MNTRTTLVAASLLASLGQLAAADLDLSKLPPAAEKAGLTYEKDIKPLFEASCFSCHGERRQRAGLRLDSREAVLQGSDEGKVIEVGKSKESSLVHAVAQIDDETAMPPKRGGRGGPGGGGPGGGPGAAGAGGGRERAGQGGPGQGQGPGRPGGRGGFDLAGMLAGGLFSQSDTDKNQKLSKAEFSGLAGTWFEKIDAKKAGKLSQQEFSAGMDEVLPPISFGGGGGGRGPGGQRGGNEGMGFGLGRFVGPAFFTAGDTDKDGSLTSAELGSTFGKWYLSWDTNKTDALSEEQFRDGFAASMPRNNPGGPGGPGGFGGFGRTALAQQMVKQGDKDNDSKLSKVEFTALPDAWFDKVDPAKSGKVTQEQFSAKLADALGMPQETPAAPAQTAPARTEDAGGRGGPGGPGGRRGGGGGPGGGAGGGVAAMGPGIFSAADGDKDGSLTRAELKATFEKWFASFDTGKAGSLDGDSLYAGLREALPAGVGGAGGFGGAGGGGTPAKPLTAAEVSLVRAWIDQGAK